MKDALPIVKLFEDLVSKIQAGGSDSPLNLEAAQNGEEFIYKKLNFKYQKSHVHDHSHDDHDHSHDHDHGHDHKHIDVHIFSLMSGIYE